MPCDTLLGWTNKTSKKGSCNKLCNEYRLLQITPSPICIKFSIIYETHCLLITHPSSSLKRSSPQFGLRILPRLIARFCWESFSRTIPRRRALGDGCIRRLFPHVLGVSGYEWTLLHDKRKACALIGQLPIFCLPSPWVDVDKSKVCALCDCNLFYLLFCKGLNLNAERKFTR